MINQRPELIEKPSQASTGRIGLFAAMSIGIGGMVGAGIFSILGVVAEASGTALWVSFVIGGVVALLSTYWYAKLGARYPSAGGAVEFLVKGFGDGVLSGGINIYMWIGYVIALALYAQAFAGYAMTFLPPHQAAWLPKAFGVGIVLVFTSANVVGANFVGRSETVIVAVKLVILVLFAVAGLLFIHPTYLTPNLWPSASGILFGAGILFIRLRGIRTGGKRGRRHGGPEEVVAQGPLPERHLGHRDLCGRFAGSYRKPRHSRDRKSEGLRSG